MFLYNQPVNGSFIPDKIRKYPNWVDMKLEELEPLKHVFGCARPTVGAPIDNGECYDEDGYIDYMCARARWLEPADHIFTV